MLGQGEIVIRDNLHNRRSTVEFVAGSSFETKGSKPTRDAGLGFHTKQLIIAVRATDSVN